MMRIAALLLIILALFGCKTKGDSGDELVDPAEVMGYKEGDSLALEKNPLALAQWIDFYQSTDRNFSLGHFKASGVILHLNELPEAISKGNEKEFERYFVYSPDSSRYLDLYSYDHFIDNGKISAGEADQQVVLADRSKNVRKQLMFNGPSESAEFASWTGPDAFIIGMTSTGDTPGKLKAELIFFHLKDSTFTNFELDHSLSMDSVILGPRKFMDHFFTNPSNQ